MSHQLDARIEIVPEVSHQLDARVEIVPEAVVRRYFQDVQNRYNLREHAEADIQHFLEMCVLYLYQGHRFYMIRVYY